MASKSVSQVKKVLWYILFANLFVAVIKIIVGHLIQSSSMSADGFHSLTDGVSNIVGLLGIFLASQPIDENHPYGHRKYECITGLFIGGMLLVIVGRIVMEAIPRLLDPVAPQVNLESLAALLITVAVNIGVCWYEYRVGKRLNSFILVSDSVHTRSDIYVSFGVLFALVAIKFGAPPIIDPVTSLLVAGCIVKAAIEIIKSTSAILVDSNAVDARLVELTARSFPQVINVHKIRSRGTDNHAFVDMHIIIDADMSIGEAHDLVHAIEEKLKADIGPHLEAMIHTEPFGKK